MVALARAVASDEAGRRNEEGPLLTGLEKRRPQDFEHTIPPDRLAYRFVEVRPL